MKQVESPEGVNLRAVKSSFKINYPLNLAKEIIFLPCPGRWGRGGESQSPQTEEKRDEEMEAVGEAFSGRLSLDKINRKNIHRDVHYAHL